MAWEKRERGGRYYTRSYRGEDGRVRREYIGAGGIAELIAHADKTIALTHKRERDRQRAEVERLEALAAPVLEIEQATDILVRASLVAGGFRNHKGEWRRERTT